MPSLWNELQILPPKDKKEWREYSMHSLQWLERSIGCTDLTVSVANPSIKIRNLESYESAVEFTILALGPHLANVVDLYMSLLLGDSFNGQDGEPEKSIEIVAPRLRRVFLDAGDFGSSDQYYCNVLTMLLPWSQLTTLDICNILLEPSTCRTLLGKCDNLVHCSLRVSVGDENDSHPPTVLAYLISLSVSFWGIEAAASFFSALTVPRLKDFKLKYELDAWEAVELLADEMQWGIDEFMEFRNRSHLDLESAHFESVGFEPAEAVQFLVDMPSLRKLKMAVSCTWLPPLDSIPFFKALTVNKLAKDSVVAPNLQEFSVDEVNDKTLQAFVEMLQSRRWPVEEQREGEQLKTVDVLFWAVSSPDNPWCLSLQNLIDAGLNFKFFRGL